MVLVIDIGLRNCYCEVSSLSIVNSEIYEFNLVGLEVKFMIKIIGIITNFTNCKIGET